LARDVEVNTYFLLDYIDVYEFISVAGGIDVVDKSKGGYGSVPENA
jgi:hypothetical protein